MLNLTSGFCETWVYGDYFDPTSDIWRSCNGRWAMDCSYQIECFQWNSTQFFDLEKLYWVDIWDSNMMSLKNSQYHNISIWKGYDIYVNPKSSSIIELGTYQNPYKSLALAFYEVLTLHSFTNNTINVYVLENSVMQIMKDQIYLINIDSVNLITYSDLGSSPLKWTIIFTDANVSVFSRRTNFNIISSYNLNISSVINNSTLSAKEISKLQSKSNRMMIDRCNFLMDNFIVQSQFLSTNKSFTFMNIIYEQNLFISLENLSFSIEGNLFNTNDPLNLFLKDIDIDYYQTSRGFIISSDWNYPNAILTSEINISNLTVYNSLPRTVLQTNSFISFYGPSNFTMRNSNISVYGSKLENFAPIEWITSTSWNPDDGIIQLFTISNTSFNLEQASDNSRFTQVSVSIQNDYARNSEIILDSNIFTGILMVSQQLYYLYANNNTKITVNNFSISNMTFLDSILYFNSPLQATISDVSFHNISKFGESLIEVENGMDINLINVLIDNWTDDSSGSLYYYEHISNIGATNITNMTVANANLTI